MARFARTLRLLSVCAVWGLLLAASSPGIAGALDVERTPPAAPRVDPPEPPGSVTPPRKSRPRHNAKPAYQRHKYV